MAGGAQVRRSNSVKSGGGKSLLQKGFGDEDGLGKESTGGSLKSDFSNQLYSVHVCPGSSH